MRALIYRGYGGIERLELADVPEPAAGARACVVQVEAAALNPKDALFRKGKFRVLSGRRFPKQCGLDFAGVVVRAGVGLSEGERVFGALQEFRFLRGTLGERVSVGAEEVARRPEGVSSADAASVALVGLTALQALRDVARVEPGAAVLINGASGGVGTVAIQLARLLGAEVTTVSSAQTHSLCAGLGAHATVGYDALPEVLASRRFDVVFDVFGNLRFGRARGALKARGVFVSTVPSLWRLWAEGVSRLAAQQERLVIVQPRRGDLERLGAWLAEGALRAVVDSRFALDDCSAAFVRLESKHAHGKIVIDVGR